MSSSTAKRWRMAFTYAIMIVIALLIVFPFYWMFMASFMAESEITSFPIGLVPKRFILENYSLYFQFNRMDEGDLPIHYLAAAGERGDIFIWVGNTLYITLIGLVGVIFASAAAAYAFAKIDFWGKDSVFLMLMTSMFMPWMVLLIPRYLFYRALDWVGTFRPLYMGWLIGGGTLVIFLYRQHFRSISNELLDAANVDGAGHLRTFFQIMMPLSKAPTAAVSVLFVMERWNDLIGPLIYLSKSRMWTMSLALFNMVRHAATANVGGTRIGYQMSGAVLLVLPAFLLFFFTQRHFVQGLVQGSVK